ncbi:hypothetical protein PRIPAC_96354 [Pristionchus pacificus]|uniref:VWA domain-containing protein n=1 Tax=Pristionchus pacificus TaxID=54126 RepID=A0A2A6D113_PRIPA|nr:hypothetical protein PRIPAC_96354 [Pristionchus pacificus]|eukprot:PDM84007.1 VWA domain-containing protein [Pristionchus pacificus]
MRLALVLLLASAVRSEDVVVRYMHILSEIQSRFATTDVVSEIENTSGNETEVVYSAELPENAFIKSFYLERDGIITQGVIKGKEDALVDFEEAKKNKKSAAHIRESNNNIFELKLALAPHAKIGFNLTYQEVLHKKNFMYKHIVNVKSNLPVKELEVNILIADKHNFSTIHVPQYEDGIGALPVDVLLAKTKDEGVIMQAATDETGSIVYMSYDPRQKFSNGQLVVLYNTTEPKDVTELQVVNGYFFHQYSPSDDSLPVANKTVVFVLDKSGSMKGNKLKQMKEAMMEILDEINENDRVNIISFDKNVYRWKDEAITLNVESKREAMKFVEDIIASGGTNLALAVQEGLELLKRAEDKQSSFMPSIMLLTDGQPTVGMKAHKEIVEHVNTLGHNYSVNSISFGKDADYSLMKKLGGREQPFGIARRIFENADAQIQIAGFYHEIAYPLLKNIKIAYLDESVDVSTVIAAGETNYFYSGDDFVQLGKLADLPSTSFSVDVEKETANGIEISKTEVTPSTGCIEADLISQLDDVETRNIQVCSKKEDPTIGNFIERMWAHLTIQKYEKLKDSATRSEAERKNVATMIKKLSLKYGFVSSQTSIIVVLDESGEEVPLEERDFEEEQLEQDAPGTSSQDLQGSDLSDNFRAPFKASSLVFSDDCRIHVVLLVDRVFRRKISAIRATRIVSDLSQSVPENVTVSVGDINNDRWIVIQGGKEEKLFEIVAANKGIRQHLMILSEFAGNMDRPFQYLSNLSPAFNKISIAKTSSSLNTNELIKLRQLGKANIIKSADALSLASTMTC